MTGLLSFYLLFSVIVEANLSDGQRLVGELKSIEDERVRISVKGIDREFQFSGVEKLKFQSPSTAPSVAGAVVELSDGSVIHAQSLRTQGDGNAEIATGSDAPIVSPIKLLRSVRWFQTDVGLKEQWDEILTNVGGDDFLVINKKGNLDYLAGIVVEVRRDSVVFDYSGNKLDIPIERVAGLAFAKKPESFGAAKIMLTTAKGSVWQLNALRSDGGSLVLTSVGGARQRMLLADVGHIEFIRAGVVFATDLEPSRVEYEPFLGSKLVGKSLRLLGSPQRDRSFDGEPISVVLEDGELKSFERGLAVQSRSQITYRLAGEYERFQATVGLDPKASAQGNLELRLFADDKEVFSQSISKSDHAIDVDVPLAKANRLRILVDFGDNLDIGDRLHLGNARFIK